MLSQQSQTHWETFDIDAEYPALFMKRCIVHHTILIHIMHCSSSDLSIVPTDFSDHFNQVANKKHSLND